MCRNLSDSRVSLSPHCPIGLVLVFSKISQPKGETSTSNNTTRAIFGNITFSPKSFEFSLFSGDAENACAYHKRNFSVKFFLLPDGALLPYLENARTLQLNERCVSPKSRHLTWPDEPVEACYAEDICLLGIIGGVRFGVRCAGARADGG
jgi:hypothetical protein